MLFLIRRTGDFSTRRKKDLLFLRINDTIRYMENIDLQWQELSAKSINVVPNDAVINYQLLHTYLHEKESPIGCHITRGDDEMRKWVCKMYLGGKQRILGYGTCYQCARLYNAALWRFRQYRIRRESDAPDLVLRRFNLDDINGQQAGDDNTRHAEMNALLCSMEKLLMSSGWLVTPDERTARSKQRKATRDRSRYTVKGRTEEWLERIFCILEPSALSIDGIEKRLDTVEKRLDAIFDVVNKGAKSRLGDADTPPQQIAESPIAPITKCEICNAGPSDGPTIHRINQPGEMPARWRCEQHMNAEQKAAIDPVVKDIVEIVEDERDSRLKLSEGQNQVVESLKHFFANNGDVQPWTGTTLQLGRLVKSTIFRYNSNRLASELIQLQDKHCVDGMWIFFAHAEPCKLSDTVQ